MKPHNERASGAEHPLGVPPRRAYVTPRLETLGTIRELTHGAGQKNQFDSTHPPGQNKSVI